MDKPVFRRLHRSKLTHPVFVEGLPGFGNVGKLAAYRLIKFTRAKCFAELYSPSFPDYVIVNKAGIIHPPRYEFYESSIGKNQFLILIGDSQPAMEDMVAHHQLCGEILDFADEQGCGFIITLGGVPTPKPKGEVYVAATSAKLASEYVTKGALLYEKGRIVGATGLLLGLAKERGYNGVCLLGATIGLGADQEAASSVFQFLMKSQGIEVNSRPRESAKGKR